MITTVIKRNGNEVPYDGQKIALAIRKAGMVSNEVIDSILDDIESNSEEKVYIEDIQDAVEEGLCNYGLYDTAKSYMLYRYKRQLIRENEKTNNSILEVIESKNEYIKGENSNKDSAIASTQRDYIAGEVSKDLTMRLLLPDEVVESHNKGRIHFHDSDYFAQQIHNCCLVNLEDILNNGTVISGTKIDKPKSFTTVCNVATQVTAVVASNQYGGQTISLSHLAPFVDISRKNIRKEVEKEILSVFTMRQLNKVGFRKYVSRKIDEITEERVKKEVHKGVKIIQYQINTLMTTNGQTPFVSVFMYLGEVENIQTKNDLAMIIEEVLRQRIKGIKNERGVFITPAFPKLLYVLEEDNIHEDSPYYYLTELSAECSAKRMVPDYISEKKFLEFKYSKDDLLPIEYRRDNWGNEEIYGKNPFKNLTNEECKVLDYYAQYNYGDKDYGTTPYANSIMNKHHIPRNMIVPKAFPCMGCRSFLAPDYIHFKSYGRFNQGVVTINLPFVALEAVRNTKGKTRTETIDEFWRVLDETLDICHTALRQRHQRLIGTSTKLSPLHWQHGALSRLSKDTTIDELLFNNYSSISLGFAGLYECTMAVTGHSHTDEVVGKDFALMVLKYMNDKCNLWKKNEGLGYSIYGTPLESTTYKFANALKKEFGVIEEVSDHDYITNSYHVNVREKIDPFTKLAFESEFQALSSGGAISYVESGGMTNNLDAMMSVIKYIYNNILYAEINGKFDYCQECGFDGEIQIYKTETGKLGWKCPNCGNTNQDKMNVARRTCGYIGNNFWNQGRTAEINDRFVHLDRIVEYTVDDTVNN